MERTTKWENIKLLLEGDNVWYRTEDGKGKIYWIGSGTITKVFSYDKYQLKTDDTHKLINRHRQDIKKMDNKMAIKRGKLPHAKKNRRRSRRVGNRGTQ